MNRALNTLQLFYRRLKKKDSGVTFDWVRNPGRVLAWTFSLSISSLLCETFRNRDRGEDWNGPFQYNVAGWLACSAFIEKTDCESA